MIEMQALTKRYGPTMAVDGLSFEVRPGRVTGFLGPREASAYVGTVPPGEPPDPKTMGEIAARHGQQNVGPPMPPRV